MQAKFKIIACDDRFGQYKNLYVWADDLEQAFTRIKQGANWRPSYRIVGWLLPGEF